MEAAAGRRPGRIRHFEAPQRQLQHRLGDVGIRRRHRGQQRLQVGMPRPAQHVVHAAELHDAAEVHDRHAAPFGDVAGRREVMGDVDDGDVQLAVQFRHQVEDRDAQADVDHGDGLVGDDDLRIQRDGSGHEDALALTARQLMRILVEKAVRRRQADRLQQLDDAGSGRLSPFDDFALQNRSGERLIDRPHRIERRIGVLLHHLHAAAEVLVALALEPGNVRSLEQYPSRGRLRQPRQDAAERRLAAAALADEGDDLARINIEIDVDDGADLLRRGHHAAAPLIVEAHSLETHQSLLLPGAGQLPAAPKRFLLQLQFSDAHEVRTSAIDTVLESGCRWQEASWPPGQTTRDGEAVLHASKACSQRGANGQPGGHAQQIRRRARNRLALRQIVVQAGHRFHQLGRIRMLGALEHVVDAARLHDIAGIHDPDPVGGFGDDADIMGEQQHRDVHFLVDLDQYVEDIRLRNDVERGRRLVENDELRIEQQAEGDHDPLLHASRHLVGERLQHAVRLQPHIIHQVAGLVDNLLLRSAASMSPVRLDDLILDPHDRVQRVLRGLEHHGCSLPLVRLELLAAQRQYVLAVEADRSGGDAAGAGYRSHDGGRERRLAAAALADESRDLAARNGKVGLVDSLQRTGAHRKLDRQSFYFDQIVHSCSSFLRVFSSISAADSALPPDRC
ncbi:hypothetical protein BN871_FY_00260 [Paenibacillus sp. P22]|nr:hypothetical protein BN871_FY_00260 [Paenibacillus sp. P22]